MLNQFSKRDKALLFLVMYPEYTIPVNIAKTAAKHVINITTPLLSKYGIEFYEIAECKPNLAEFQNNIAALEVCELITPSQSKRLLEYHFAEPCLGWDVTSAILCSKLLDVEDSDKLIEAIRKVISNNTTAVEDIKSGKEKAIGSLIGQVMKLVKSDPVEVRKLIISEIGATNENYSRRV